MDEENKTMEDNQEIEKLRGRIKELEETLKSRDDDVKILSDRVGELESDLKQRDETVKNISEERDRLKNDIDKIKQNGFKPSGEENKEEEEPEDLADVFRSIKNIMF